MIILNPGAFNFCVACAAPNAVEEMHLLRSRAEAIVAFSNMAIWTAVEASGEMHMPGAMLQRLASWLADMA